jgi:hypothetical protein
MASTLLYQSVFAPVVFHPLTKREAPTRIKNREFGTNVARVLGRIRLTKFRRVPIRCVLPRRSLEPEFPSLVGAQSFAPAGDRADRRFDGPLRLREFT